MTNRTVDRLSRLVRGQPRPAARKVFDVAAGMPWAITPEHLQLILRIAARKRDVSIEAIEAELGRPLDNTRTVSIRDGVAIVPVTGPIFRYASLFSRISGATSIQDLALDFTTALNDPDVTAILLDIDSPGGEVNGTSELAQMIYDARSVKPIVAYIGGLGCSAAYWIASACDRVVVADTAFTGSIGVIAAFQPDPDGEDPIELVSSQSPKKAPDPETDSGRAQIQATLDRIAEVFIDAVARNRDVSSDTVLSDFGQGDVFVGADGVSAGLADGVGSFESVLAAMATGEDPAPPQTPVEDAELPPLPADDPVQADPTPHIQQQPAADVAMSDPETHNRRQNMKLTDWLRTKAAAEGVEIEDCEELRPTSTADTTDIVAMTRELDEAKAKLELLQSAQAERDAEAAAAIAQAHAQARHLEATAFVDGLITSHRLPPASAESLVPLVEAIRAGDSHPEADGSPTQLLTVFAQSLPDMSLFTTEQVKSDKAAALFTESETPIPGEEKADVKRQERILASTAVGREVLAERKATAKK